MKKLSPRLRLTVAVILAHFVNDVPLALLPAVLPILIAEFNLSYGSSGALITTSSFLMTSLQAVTGYVADRRNRIKFLLIGLITLGLGTLLISFSANYAQLLLFECVVGLGASFYHPIGYALLSDAFETGNRGKALGWGSAAGDLATPVAFIMSGLLVLILGWRNIFILWGLTTIMVSLIIPFIAADPKKASPHPTVTAKSTKQVVVALIPVIVVMGIATACYKIVVSFTTTYLTTFGIDISSANNITALMMIIGAVGSVMGGTLIDKFGEKKTVLGELTALGLLCLMASYVRNEYFISILFCLIGFVLLSVFPSFYSAIASKSNLGSRSLIYGLLFAIAWSFGSIFPYISGSFADIFGLYVTYILAGVLAILGGLIWHIMFKGKSV